MSATFDAVWSSATSTLACAARRSLSVLGGKKKKIEKKSENKRPEVGTCAQVVECAREFEICLEFEGLQALALLVEL